MTGIYRATLYGNRLEWSEEKPQSLPPDRGVEVFVTIPNKPVSAKSARQRGAAMAAALEQLAAAGGPKSFGDAAKWERTTREERALSGRDS